MLWRIGTLVLVLVLDPSLSYFDVADVSFLARIRTMVPGLIVKVGETTLPSFSEALFYNSLEYFHFSCDFFYFSSEQVDLAHLLPKGILVCFSERAEFVE